MLIVAKVNPSKDGHVWGVVSDCVEERMVIYKYEAKAVRRENCSSELRMQEMKVQPPGVEAIWSSEVDQTATLNMSDQ